MPSLPRALLNLVVSFLPRRHRRAAMARGEVLAEFLLHGGRAGVLRRARVLGMREKWVRDVPDPGAEGAKTARNLGELWLEMKRRQGAVESGYQPTPEWSAVLETAWRPARTMIEGGQWPGFEKFLRHFFRNGAVAGIWDPANTFDRFAREGREDLLRAAAFARRLAAWRALVGDTATEALAEPGVGNPWGFDVNGRLVMEPTVEHHALARKIRDLLAGVDRPVVLEIGGGYGGFARQLLHGLPGARYIGLDLPENLILQAWYLSRSLPDRNVLVGVDAAGAATMNPGDAWLGPNWTLERLVLPRIDVVVNVRSFGEMSLAAVRNYFAQIERLRPRWVFHENLAEPRGDGLYGMASAEYPLLAGYRLIMSRESAWPEYARHSAYPCREYLLQRNATEQAQDADLR